MAKTLNTLFSLIYAFFFFGMLWYWIETDLIKYLFQVSHEGIPAFLILLLFFITLSFFIFIHYRLRNKPLSFGHKLFLSFTAFDFLYIIVIMIKALMFGGGESVLSLYPALLLIPIFWLVLITMGFMLIKENKYKSIDQPNNFL